MARLQSRELHYWRDKRGHEVDFVLGLLGASERRYQEFTLYSGQSFGYPQIMSDLDGQRLLLVGARYTAHFHYFSRFTLNWNADLKPIALYSNDIYGPMSNKS